MFGPDSKLVRIIVEPLRDAPVSPDGALPALGLIAERRAALALECGACPIVRLKVDHVFRQNRKHHAVDVKPGAAKHAAHAHWPKLCEQLVDMVRSQAERNARWPASARPTRRSRRPTSGSGC